jgi:hypothetical protein
LEALPVGLFVKAGGSWDTDTLGERFGVKLADGVVKPPFSSSRLTEAEPKRINEDPDLAAFLLACNLPAATAPAKVKDEALSPRSSRSST